MSYIKRLKRIISISVNNHWISFNPFVAFKCTTRKVVRQETKFGGLQKKNLQSNVLKKLEIALFLAAIQDTRL